MKIDEIRTDIEAKIAAAYWPGYVHCYPHKKAYRPMQVDLRNAWDGVKQHNLYLHIPFCRRKCAYCNLFSCVQLENSLDQYVDALCKEMDMYGSLLKDSTLMSIYFGGGTPSLLTESQLKRIFLSIHKNFHLISDEIEPCLESSPDDLTTEYLRILKEVGLKRISVGVQSFSQVALNDINRKYDSHNIYTISDNLHKMGMSFNIDLIYGLPNQTELEAISNVKKAVELKPESITIYPLAIRQLTGLESIGEDKVMSMRDKYDLFPKLRKILEDSGYRCQTVVRFVRTDKSTYQQQRLEYMGIPTVGVGAGARSYAPKVHYCLPYKIDQHIVKGIIEKYINTKPTSLDYDAFYFDEDELKRKYVTLFLLDPGINVETYKKSFSSDVMKDFRNELEALLELSMIKITDGMLVLTDKGRQYSDIAVEVFQSEQIKALYDNYIPE